MERNRKEQSDSLWRDTLTRMTEEQLREFLGNILAKDQGWRDKLLLKFGPPEDEAVLRDGWEMQLDELIQGYHRGRSRYIDYRDAYTFYVDLREFLEERLQVLMDRGQRLAAFELTCTVYHAAMDEEADNSDGGMTILMDRCISAWRDILSAVSPKEQETIYHRFRKESVDASKRFGGTLFEEFLFSYPWDMPCLKRNLDLLEKRIAAEEKYPYHVCGLLEQEEYTLRLMGKTEAEIDAFWHKNWKYDFARDKQLERLMERREYGAAEEQLRQEFIVSASKSLRLQESSEKLIELYQITGQEEKYRTELIRQIEKYQQTDMDHVQQLRDIVGEDWPQWLERLLKLRTTTWLRLPLLAMGERWPSLYAEVERRKNLSALEEYLEPLMAWDADKVQKLYTPLIHEQMAVARDRRAYSAVLHRMSKLKQCAKGQELIDQILAEWREKYPRRSSMLEEMQRAKRERIL